MIDRLPAVEHDVPLVEVLDRALGAGVVIDGDLTLSLAGVDLIHVSLRLMLGSDGLSATGTPLEGPDGGNGGP